MSETRLYFFPYVDGALRPTNMMDPDTFPGTHYLVVAESAQQARSKLARHRGNMDVCGVPAPETLHGDVFFIEGKSLF